MSRRAGFLDHFSLWASLGASLYLMPFGALLVPALSIEHAVLATVLAGLIGGLVIACIAAVAASSGRSTAELLTRPFGDRARIPVSVLLVLRHLLFAVFALIIMSDSAELISDRSLGAGLRPVWVVIFAIAGLALVLAGEQRVSVALRRVGVWLVLLVAIAVSLSAYMEFEIPSYLRRPAAGGWPSFWQAFDIMLIFPLLFLPVVADFARHGADSRSTAGGAFLGVFLTAVWFGTLGIIYLPATDSGDIPGFLVGMQLGLGAVAILFLLQADELYVSAQASIPALQSIRDYASVRFVAIAAVGAAAPIAVWLNVRDLEPYVLLVAAIFIPAFAVVLAQTLVSQRSSAFTSVPAWVGGFVIYQWITPAEIGWWRDAVSVPFDALAVPFPLSEEVTWLGAAIPSFLVAFSIATLVPLVIGLLQSPARAAQPAG